MGELALVILCSLQTLASPWWVLAHPLLTQPLTRWSILLVSSLYVPSRHLNLTPFDVREACTSQLAWIHREYHSCHNEWVMLYSLVLTTDLTAFLFLVQVQSLSKVLS